MYTANSLIYCAYLNMEASHRRQTTYSSVITLTEASSRSRRSCFCSLTRSSSRRTFSYWEATTSVVKLTEFMDSTTSAKIDFQSVCGRNSRMSSTACPLRPSLTTRSCACMEASPPSLSQSPNFSKSLDPPRYLKTVSCAIYSGQTPRKANRAGVKTIGVYRTRLARQ